MNYLDLTKFSCDLWEEFSSDDFYWNRMAYVYSLNTAGRIMMMIMMMVMVMMMMVILMMMMMTMTTMMMMRRRRRTSMMMLTTSREASSVIEQSPAAMQLRYLQTLNSISSGNQIPKNRKHF